MISEKDAIFFHEPSSKEDAPYWAETNAWTFYVPEEGIMGIVYTLFRKLHGIVLTNVCIVKWFCHHPYEALHNDFYAHLPIPEGIEIGKYSLANGLSVEVTKPPMDYRVDYVARDGTELHFTYEGLGLPYDIQDPEMDPITAKSSPEDHAKHQGFGTAYNGHFDHSGHLRGKLKLRGKTYPIDIVSTMDHSWGQRPESRSGSMAWGNIHFGRDLAIHSIFTIDPRAGEAYGPLAHGYVTENGECHGLVDGKGRVTERDGFYTLGVEVEVEDIRGKSFRYTGRAMATYPWYYLPNVCGFHSMLEYEMDGRKAYGGVMDFLHMDYLAQGRPL